MLPQQIKAFEGEHIVTASCGQNSSCVINSKGELYTFGWPYGAKFEKSISDIRPKLLRPPTRSPHV